MSPLNDVWMIGVALSLSRWVGTNCKIVFILIKTISFSYTFLYDLSKEIQTVHTKPSQHDRDLRSLFVAMDAVSYCTNDGNDDVSKISSLQETGAPLIIFRHCREEWEEIGKLYALLIPRYRLQVLIMCGLST